MKKLLPLSILLTVIANGCVTRVERFDSHPETPPPAPVDTQAATKSNGVADKRVIIDHSLARIIRLVKITSSTSRDGYLKIQLNIQNMTDAFQKFRYRLDWLDDQGMSLPMAETSPMDWTLLRGETSFLAATSPTPAAKSFRVVFAVN